MIQIGNAPCSWGVEFADDPQEPCPGGKFLKENASKPDSRGSSLVPWATCRKTLLNLSEALGRVRPDPDRGRGVPPVPRPEDAVGRCDGRFDQDLQGACGPWCPSTWC